MWSFRGSCSHGVLVKRIYRDTDLAAARHPEIEFLKAGYLNDHPAVVDTFVERVAEADEGLAAMDCRLCKYRERMPGFEDEAGLPQVSHHHHVEGIGTGGEAAPHTHAHTHHPYPHRAHPLGPAGGKAGAPER